MATSKKVARSADTGEFVSADEAKANPDETVVETVDKPKAKSKAKPKAAPKKSAEDLEREAEFARKCRVYELALRQGTPEDYQYGDPSDPQWPEVRQAVKDKRAADEAEAEAEAQRVAQANRDANAEAKAKAAAKKSEA